MPDENEQTAETETTEVPVDEQPKDDAQEGDKPAEEQPEDESTEESEEGKDDDLPEWARTKLTKANNEAASYRTKLREAEQKLQNAKSLEEVDEIVNNLRAEREESERALLIENVALKFKLPEAVQKRLTGKTREELEADAKELADLFGSEDEDDDPDLLEGGLNPRTGDPEANLGPRELAKQYGRGSKRRR